MSQATVWREKAKFYWNLSKSVMDYDLCEQYAELAARYLDLAEALENQAASGAANGGQSRKARPSA
jgi:hypothetical protein